MSEHTAKKPVHGKRLFHIRFSEWAEYETWVEATCPMAAISRAQYEYLENKEQSGTVTFTLTHCETHDWTAK
jgi:penicillin-binding protein-related factor A (putative recombinase)